MTYRKRTLRSMPPTTRRLARLIGEIESVSRRAKNLLEEIQTQERESQALRNRDAHAMTEIDAAMTAIGEERRELGRECMERQT